MISKANLIRRLAHNLDGDDRRARWLVAGIAGVGEGLGDEREASARQVQDRNGPVPVLHVGRLRIEDECTPVRVDQRLALAAFDLLTGVVAARPAALHCFDSLAVEHCGGWRGFPSDTL